MAAIVTQFTQLLVNTSVTPFVPLLSSPVTVTNMDNSAATCYSDITGATALGSNVVNTDPAGNLTVFLAPATADGTGRYKLTPSGLGTTTIQVGAAAVSIVAYGADPTGVADSTTAINAAAAAGNRLWCPPGTYIYNGTGITNTTLAIVADPGTVTIMLGASSYLVQTTAAIVQLLVRGINTQGGKGVVRQSYTGQDTTSVFKIVEKCYFYGYTGTAIASLASDGPYWQIRHNMFWSANDTTTKGIVFSGYTDLCSIDHNDIRRNRVGIMFCQGGNNCSVSANNFMRSSAYAGTQRTDIWVVPNTSTVASGMGLVVDEQCRFGNEFLDSNDLRIVYADIDTLAGTETTDRWPKLLADSTGNITGHRIAGTFIGVGTGGTNNALIYSTTPNMNACRWGDIVHDGSADMIVQVRTVPLPVSRVNCDNIIGPVTSTLQFNAPTLATNAPDLAHIVDPQGCLAAGTLISPVERVQSNPADYINQLNNGIRAFTTGAGGSLANIADAYGGADAAELTFTGPTSLIYSAAANAAMSNQNLWVEFEVAAGSATPLTTLEVILADFNSVQHRTWFITVPSVGTGWVPVMLGPHNFRTISGGGWSLLFQAALAGKVKVGRVRMYQARNPVLKDLSIARATTVIAAPAAGAAAALPATPAGYMTVYVNGVARQLAYY